MNTDLVTHWLPEEFQIIRQPYRPRILFLDDEPSFLALVGRALRNFPFELYLQEDPFEALRDLRKKPVDIVVVDFRMPQMNGLEFVERMRHMSPLVPSVMLSAAMDEGLELQAADAGCHGMFEKPCSLPALAEHLQRIMKRAA